MKKLLRHGWIKQLGFKEHRCDYCGVTRYWDDGFKKIMFKWTENGVPKVGYKPPECKRIMHCDKIEL